MRTIYWALSLALIHATFASPLRADPARRLAEAYARRHGFATRTLTTGPHQRQVKRCFVPVTPVSFADFLTTFSKGNGFAHVVSGHGQLALGLRPAQANGVARDCYLWARNRNGEGGADLRHMHMKHSQGARVIAVDLSGAPLRHLVRWLAPDGAGPKSKWARDGNCMAWLPNAEVGPDKPLFHHLGITRSVSGRNMQAKLIHAADRKVPVVGVCVAQAAEFDKMDDREMLGNPPQAGVEDAARQALPPLGPK